MGEHVLGPSKASPRKSVVTHIRAWKVSVFAVRHNKHTLSLKETLLFHYNRLLRLRVTI